MIGPFAAALIALSLLIVVAGAVTAARGRAMGTVLLGALAVLETALLVQAGLAIAALAGGQEIGETATFVGYLIGVLVIPPAAAFLGLAERSRWGAVVVAVGGFAVCVMVGRLLQLWQGAA
ncbi:hypothetical protein AB0D67_20250 [Streptosporangium sp. NPDC048047]|uniref:hypothetical protein n=1 Tax=unclassified Streptosporangium TaxID=2632669 RepID=UPI0034232D4D